MRLHASMAKPIWMAPFIAHVAPLPKLYPRSIHELLVASLWVVSEGYEEELATYRVGFGNCASLGRRGTPGSPHRWETLHFERLSAVDYLLLYDRMFAKMNPKSETFHLLIPCHTIYGKPQGLHLKRCTGGLPPRHSRTP